MAAGAGDGRYAADLFVLDDGAGAAACRTRAAGLAEQAHWAYATAMAGSVATSPAHALPASVARPAPPPDRPEPEGEADASGDPSGDTSGDINGSGSGEGDCCAAECGPTGAGGGGMLAPESPFHVLSGVTLQGEVLTTRQVQIHPSLTTTSFLSTSYRVVFSLDVSPSMASVDTRTGKVAFELLLSSLSNCLHSLVQPVDIPGLAAPICPRLWVTILAQTHPNLQPLYPVRVLVQGALATVETLPDLLASVTARFNQIEDTLSSAGGPTPVAPPVPCLIGPLKIPVQRPQVKTVHDAAFPKTLKNGLFAINMLPNHATSVLVVFTDGVVSFPNKATLDATLASFCNSSTTCHFVQIGSGHSPQCSLGSVADSELLHFVATATNGTVIVEGDAGLEDGGLLAASQSGRGPERMGPAWPNSWQRKLLLSRYRHDPIPPGHVARLVPKEYLSSHSSLLPRVDDPDEPDGTEALPFGPGDDPGFGLPITTFVPPPVILLRRKWKSYVLRMDLPALLKSRFRRGWRIVALDSSAFEPTVQRSFIKPGTTLVRLALPLLQHVRVECTLLYGPGAAASNDGSSAAGKDAPKTAAPASGWRQLIRVQLELVAPYLFHQTLSRIKHQGQPVSSSGGGTGVPGTLPNQLPNQLQAAAPAAVFRFLLDQQNFDFGLMYLHSYPASASWIAQPPALVNPLEPLFRMSPQQQLYFAPLDDKSQARLSKRDSIFVEFWTAVAALDDESVLRSMPTEQLAVLLAPNPQPQAPSLSSVGACSLVKWDASRQDLVRRLSAWTTLTLTRDTYVYCYQAPLPPRPSQPQPQPQPWAATAGSSGGAAAAPSLPAFALLRLAGQDGLVVVQVGFLNASRVERAAVLRSLRNVLTCQQPTVQALALRKLSRLGVREGDGRIPAGLDPYESTTRHTPGSVTQPEPQPPRSSTATTAHGRGADRDQSLWVSAKNLEQLLVRYNKVPADLLTFGSAGQGTAAARQERGAALRVTSYMAQTRWLWDLDVSSSPDACTPTVVSWLERLRLREGFRIVHHHVGIKTFALELVMQPTAEVATAARVLLQYVLFPSGIPELAVCEAWTEPQAGVCVQGPPFLLGANCGEVIERLHRRDLALIVPLSAFEFLRSRLCSDIEPSPVILRPAVAPDCDPAPHDKPRQEGGARVVPVPFGLDLAALLAVSSLCHCRYKGFISPFPDPDVGSGEEEQRACATTAEAPPAEQPPPSGPAPQPSRCRYLLPILLSRQVVSSLERLNDAEIELSEDDHRALGALLAKRCGRAAQHRGIFRCYASKVDTASFLLTVVEVPQQGDCTAHSSEEAVLCFEDPLLAARGEGWGRSSYTLVGAVSVYVFECSEEEVLSLRDEDGDGPGASAAWWARHTTVRDQTGEPLSALLAEDLEEDDEIARYFRRMDDSYARSYARAAFRRVQQRLPLGREYLDHVLDACIATEQEIDLGPFLLAQHAARPHLAGAALDGTDVGQDLQERFKQLYSKLFRFVPEDPDVMYYRRRDDIETERDEDAATTADAADLSSVGDQSAPATPRRAPAGTDEGPGTAPVPAPAHGHAHARGSSTASSGPGAPLQPAPSEDERIRLFNSFQPFGIAQLLAASLGPGEAAEETDAPMFLQLQASIRTQAAAGSPGLYHIAPVFELPVRPQDVLRPAGPGGGVDPGSGPDLDAALLDGRLHACLHITALTLPAPPAADEDGDDEDEETEADDEAEADTGSASTPDAQRGTGGGAASPARLPSMASPEPPAPGHLPSLRHGLPSVLSSPQSMVSTGAEPDMDSAAQQALSVLVYDIKWLLEDETLAALLAAPPPVRTTPALVGRIVRHLREKPPCPVVSSLDQLQLGFVDPTRGRELFAQALSFDALGPYRAVRVGDVHVVLAKEGVDLGAPLPPHPDRSTSPTPEPDWHRLDSYEEPPAIDSEALDRLFGEERPPAPGGVVHNTPFCIALRVGAAGSEGDGVEVFHFTRATELTQQEGWVLATLRALLEDACRRANQGCLLEQVAESQTCNELLLPPADPGSGSTVLDGSARPEASPTPALLVEHKLSRSSPVGDGASAPLQPPAHAPQSDEGPIGLDGLALPLVFRKTFDLHPRVEGSRGLAVVVRALEHFEVHNAEHTYVCREDSSANIFLMRVGLDSSVAGPAGAWAARSLGSRRSSRATLDGLDDFSPVPGFGGNPDAGPPTFGTVPGGAGPSSAGPDAHNLSAGDTSLLGSGLDAVSLSSASPGLSRSRTDTLTSMDTREELVWFEVYGIARVGPDIGRDLVEMLANKLDATTASVLSLLIGRNPKLRLTQRDLDFLRPPAPGPTLELHLNLPSFVHDQFAFLMYLRQALLRFLLEYHGPEGPPSSALLSAEAPFVALPVTATTFVYNNAPRDRERERIEQQRQLASRRPRRPMARPAPAAGTGPAAAAAGAGPGGPKANRNLTARQRFRDEVLAAVDKGIAIVACELDPSFAPGLSPPSPAGSKADASDRLSAAASPPPSAASRTPSRARTPSTAHERGVESKVVYVSGRHETQETAPPVETLASLFQHLPSAKSDAVERQAAASGLSPPSPARLFLPIWARGKMDAAKLGEFLVASVHQVICDYAMEKHILPRPLTADPPALGLDGGAGDEAVVDTDGPAPRGAGSGSPPPAREHVRNRSTASIEEMRTIAEAHQQPLDPMFSIAVPRLVHASSRLSSASSQSFSFALPAGCDTTAVIRQSWEMMRGFGACRFFVSTTTMTSAFRGFGAGTGVEDVPDLLREIFVASEVSSLREPAGPSQPPSSRRRSGQVGSAQGRPGLILCSDAPHWAGPAPSQQSPASAPAPASATSPQQPKPKRAVLLNRSTSKFLDHLPRVRRHSLCALLFFQGRVRVFLYNWNASSSQRVQEKLTSLVQWTHCRHYFLGTVLNAKMGLFHHVPTLEDGSITFHSLQDIGMVVENVARPKRRQFRKLPASSVDSVPMVSALLRDFPDEMPVQTEGSAVRRHGLQLSAFLEQSARDRAHRERIRRLCVQWDGIHQGPAAAFAPPPSGHEAIPTTVRAEEVAEVRQLMQAVQQWSTPLMVGADAVGEASEQVLQGRELGWHQDLLLGFCELYTKYARSLGFVPICVDASTAVAEDSAVFDDGGAIGALHTPTTYLYCRVEAEGTLPTGLFLLEVKGEGTLARVQLHAMDGQAVYHLHFPDAQPLTAEEELEMGAGFARQCAQFVAAVRLPSFGYDFSLYNISRLLLDAGLPAGDVQIMDVVRRTLQASPFPPPAARNFLGRYSFELPHYRLPARQGPGSRDVSPSVLAEYMCKRPHAYGLCLVRQAADRRILCRRTTPIRQFDSRLDVVLLFCPDLQPEGDSLQFFLLQTEAKKRFPRPPAPSEEEAGGAPLGREAVADGGGEPAGAPLVSALVSGRATAAAAAAARAEEHEAWLGVMLRDAFTHFQRDQLWARLQGGGPGLSKAGLSEPELADLLALVSVVDFERSDPSLHALLVSEMEWKLVLRSLLERFASRARQVRFGGSSTTLGSASDKSQVRLVILHESHPDVCALVHHDGQRLHASLVQREDARGLAERATALCDSHITEAAAAHAAAVGQAGHDHMALVVNALGCFLWRTLILDP